MSRPEPSPPHRLAVYVVFEWTGRTLFLRRRGTGYEDGLYGLPSGKVEAGEGLLRAAVREVAEEVGLEVTPEQLTLCHVMERLEPPAPWIDFFFTCSGWTGEPYNAAPDRCEELVWLAPGHPDVIDHINQALRSIQDGIELSSLGG